MHDSVEIKGPIPKKDLLLMAVLYTRVLLFLPFVKSYIRKRLPTCVNVDFIPGFQFFYGNIVAQDTFLCDAFILDYAPVYIGAGTKFSFGCMVVTSSHDPLDFSTIKAQSVSIGKNVYIGARSIILKGVSIGDNVIIGAGSVVVKDIPENVFAAGNPCEVIKKVQA